MAKSVKQVKWDQYHLQKASIILMAVVVLIVVLVPLVIKPMIKNTIMTSERK